MKRRRPRRNRARPDLAARVTPPQLPEPLRSLYNDPMMTPAHLESVTLAAAPGRTFGDMAPVLIWIGALMAAVIVGIVILLAVRRHAMALDDAELDASLGMTLHDLRTMRAEGMIDEDEFERMKALVVGQAGARHDHDLVRAMREARHRAEEAGVLRARPGFDLTGEPLPGSGEESTEDPPKTAES